jgi:uncharacterized protein YkwD
MPHKCYNQSMHRLLVGLCIAIIITSLPFAALLFFTPSPKQIAAPPAPTASPEPFFAQNAASPTLTVESPAIAQATNTPTSVLGASTKHTSTQKEAAQFTTEKLYLLINAHRKEHTLSPLQPAPELELSALLKISDMIAKNYWRHADPTNIESWPLFKQAGYNYLLAGENLSFAINSPWGVFSSWAASPTHNEQLLTKEYAHMGAAIDCTTYQKLAEQPCIVVLHLGKR